MSIVLAIAAKEVKDGLRNRWIIAISLIFVLMAVGLAYFGSAAAGQVGFSTLSTTIVSLASLTVFIIPLIALLLAYDSLIGEDENGTLLLLLSYPLSRWQLVLGKMLGHAAILALSTLLGFGSAAIIMGLFSDAAWSELIPAFTLFISSAILLGWTFVAFAYVISAIASEQSKAAGMALLLWFGFVLVFDLGLLGVLVGTQGRVKAEVFPYLLLLNPADIFRLVNINYFAYEQLSGLMEITQHVKLSTAALLLTQLLWLLVPASSALWIFQRRKL